MNIVDTFDRRRKYIVNVEIVIFTILRITNYIYWLQLVIG